MFLDHVFVCLCVLRLAAVKSMHLPLSLQRWLWSSQGPAGEYFSPLIRAVAKASGNAMFPLLVTQGGFRVSVFLLCCRLTHSLGVPRKMIWSDAAHRSLFSTRRIKGGKAAWADKVIPLKRLKQYHRYHKLI